MERLGFLKLSLILASPQGSYLADYVEEASRLVNSTIRVPHDPSFARWLASNGLGKSSGFKEIETPVQYWWVFNYGPSQTGWLSRLGVREYFDVLPRKAGLLESDFAPTELGSTLTRGFISEDEVINWQCKTISQTSPLALTMGQKAYFIYVVLRADGDFLLSLLASMLSQLKGEPFGYLDVGKLIPPALDEMASVYRGAAFSDDDQRELAGIWERRDLIDKQNRENVEKEGSGSSREQLSIPRLEWLLDVGVLQKNGSRNYQFTHAGYELARSLTSYYRVLLNKSPAEECLSRLLDEYFFGPVIEFLRGNGRKCERHEYLQLVREAYDALKGPMGYVRLRSMLILMHGRQAESGAPTYMEYREALRIIEDEHRERPRLIYYTVDRLGGEHQVKFEQEPRH